MIIVYLWTHAALESNAEKADLGPAIFVLLLLARRHSFATTCSHSTKPGMSLCEVQDIGDTSNQDVWKSLVDLERSPRGGGLDAPTSLKGNIGPRPLSPRSPSTAVTLLDLLKECDIHVGYYDLFEQRGITSVRRLKKLTAEELEEIFPEKKIYGNYYAFLSLSS